MWKVTAHLDVTDFPEQAGFDDLLLRVDEMRRAFALRADLDYALVPARGVEHGFALAHVPADRFLAIDIRARFHRGDGVQRVPMVRRADQHDVEVLLLEHLAVIAVSARLFFGLLALAGDLDGLGQHVFVRIADRDDLDRRDLNEPPQIALAVPAGADQPHALGFFSGEGGRHITGRGHGENGGGSLSEELATVHGFGLSETGKERKSRKWSIVGGRSNWSVSLPFRYRFATDFRPWVDRAIDVRRRCGDKDWATKGDAGRYVDLARVFSRAHSQPGTRSAENSHARLRYVPSPIG